MKKLFLAFIFLAFSYCGFAMGIIEDLFDTSLEVWFSPYPAAFNVNLEDSGLYPGVAPEGDQIPDNGNGLPVGVKGPSEGYSDTALIGVVGFGGVSTIGGELLIGWLRDNINSVRFDITFDSGGESWNYVSASEPYLKRPFGIDVVLNYCDVNDKSTGRERYLAARLGYDDNPNFTDTEGTTFGIEVDKDKALESGSFWIGLYLKLPDENVDLSSALSADDYYSSMHIVMTVYYGDNQSDSFSWSYIFNGYIGEELDDLETQVFLNIVPDAQANSINVADLEGGKSVTIGEYSYVSQAYLPESYGGNPSSETMANASYYVFASSSPDPTLPGGLFRLVSTGIESAPSAENVIYYQVGIDSANIAGTGTADKWYNGQDTLSSFSTDTDSLVEGDSRREQLSYDYSLWNGYTRYYSITFEDSGSLMIRAADAYGNQNTSFLASDYRAGVYTSTVYLHVVSTQ